MAMQKVTVFRKYRYKGKEHTMIRTKEGSEKIMVCTGETFTSALGKNIFTSTNFEFLGETIEEQTAPKKMEDVLDVRTIGTPKEESTWKKKAQELYQAKFGKRPFPGWDEATILSKLS